MTLSEANLCRKTPRVGSSLLVLVPGEVMSETKLQIFLTVSTLKLFAEDPLLQIFAQSSTLFPLADAKSTNSVFWISANRQLANLSGLSLRRNYALAGRISMGLWVLIGVCFC